jgi:hypothetical protein
MSHVPKKMSVEKKVFKGGVFKTEPADPIDYIYDDDKGSLIDYKCYNKIISDYATSPPANTNVLHYFSKQILLFLLSFEECVGVVVCKCKNPDTHQESVTLCATDVNGKPLGWNYTTSTEAQESKFVGAEWGKSISSVQLAQTIKQHPVTKEKYVDMSEFFSMVTKLVEDKPDKYETQE